MIDKEIIKKVAKNARLELKDKEIEKDLSTILDSFKLISEVKQDSEPSFQPFEIKNVLRDDKKEESLSQEDALKNTEQKQDKFFKGPRAV